MLYLITGTPGSGKTLYAVSLIVKYLKENEQLLKDGKEPRRIYADIDGLNIEGVDPPPEDWRETPDGSVIFYDEIQQRPSYKKEKNDNDIVNALQIHRHTGHDIYGITQFPVLLHQNFKAVVGLHYHLHRGWGLPSATVYQWAYCVDAPNAPSNKKLAEHSFRFNYPKELFDYYKSATQHTHTARIPKKFILLVIAVICLAYISFSLLFADNNFFTKTLTGKTGETVTMTADKKQQSQTEQQTKQNDEDLKSSEKKDILTAQQPDPVQQELDMKIQRLQKQIQLEQLEAQYAQLQSARQPKGVIMNKKSCKSYNYDGTTSDCNPTTQKQLPMPAMQTPMPKAEITVTPEPPQQIVIDFSKLEPMLIEDTQLGNDFTILTPILIEESQLEPLQSKFEPLDAILIEDAQLEPLHNALTLDIAQSMQNAPTAQ